MVLKQLVYLIALAHEKHFGRAAAFAHISQPTLSAAIRALEEELGAPVVERGHRFNGFTPQGELVLEHAQRILAECDALRQNLAEMAEGLNGRLRLGVIPTALPTIALATAAFQARFPRVALVILSQTSTEILRGLEHFEIDAGFSYLDNEPLEHVRSKPIYREDFVFLTPIDQPYAKGASISWLRAAGAPLCLLTPDMQNRRIIDGVFRSVGAEPCARIETNSVLNLCSHVSLGHCSTIIPKSFVQTFGLPTNTIALALTQPEVSRTVGLVIADREPASPLARALFVHAQAIDLDREGGEQVR